MRRLAGSLFTERKLFRLCFAGAVITSVLVSPLTNVHDLCLLLLPLALVADHCSAQWPSREVRALLISVVPLLVSPLWIFLWMRWGRLNLLVILLLWLIYAIRREVARLQNAGSFAPAGVNPPV